MEITVLLKNNILNRGKKAGDMKILAWLEKNNLGLYMSSKGYVFAHLGTNGVYSGLANTGIDTPKYVREGLAKILNTDINHIASSSRYYKIQYPDGAEDIFASYNIADYKHYEMYKGYPPIKVLRGLTAQEMEQYFDTYKN
jgi:hypothetical protein